MQSVNFEEAVDKIVARDPRYQRDAYMLLREGLDYAQKNICKAKAAEPHHVTGKELLSGLRDYCLAQYGPMAAAVLDAWGIHCCEDFGEIVFNMIDQALLSKTETDTRDDFKGGYDFDEAFRRPFRPVTKLVANPASESKPTQISADK